MRIIIGEGSCGIAAGALKVRSALEKLLEKEMIGSTGCIGMCFLEPIVDIYEGKNLLKIFSAMISWALENAIDTADSMKARGYGLPGRTAFSIFIFDKRDLKTLLYILY